MLYFSLKVFGTVIEQAKKSSQRRMVVTDQVQDVLSWTKGLSGLHMGWDKLKISGFKFMSFKDSKDALGETYNHLVLDLRGSFSANDLARVIPAVRGGGVIILLTPPLETWATSKLNYHKRLASPPFTVDDARTLFIPRIIRKLYEHEGIWIKRGEKFEKESLEVPLPKAEKLVPKGPLQSLAKSSDQIDFLNKVDVNGINVLLANRGRGKSAALGLLIADLRARRNKKTEVVVTSRSRDAVKVVFEFIEKGLDELSIPYGYKKGILLGKKIKVVFEEPEGAISRKADLFIVDEASSIPIGQLKELAKKDAVVFSTTVHGYEGSGRVFSLIFMNELKNKGYNLLTMESPIRYAKGDPIEAWLFDTFLLDAEPDPVSLGKLEFTLPPMKEVFSHENELRGAFGLLVTAHYMNTPNDLQIMADAPHHSLGLTLSNGKIIGAVQIAEEGGLSDSQIGEMCNDERPEGNILPDIVCKHYGLKDFSKLKGKRVVRIVTNPAFWGKGIGSFMLEKLEAADWVGSSFGASSKLVRFWVKNGFLPVAIGPYRNPKSGEYALAVLKPISKRAREQTKLIHEEFENRFLGSLSDVYWDMDPFTVREILKSFSHGKKPVLSILELKRLSLLLSGKHVYEFDVDIATKLVKWYFSSGGDYLSESEEVVLISKVLQRAMWKVVKEKTGTPRIFDTIKDGLKKVASHL